MHAEPCQLRGGAGDPTAGLALLGRRLPRPALLPPRFSLTAVLKVGTVPSSLKCQMGPWSLVCSCPHLAVSHHSGRGAIVVPPQPTPPTPWGSSQEAGPGCVEARAREGRLHTPGRTSPESEPAGSLGPRQAGWLPQS